jgi:2-polyprenyl-3-methyl-5-hydroxy-6-metoxy-1,4-benzoquinol methylase
MARSQGDERSSARIDQRYYETSGYFEEGGRHLLDPGSRFQRYRIREVLKLCGDLNGNRAVDLGCGWGTISFALAEDAEAVVGVDFAEASLRLCRSRHDLDRYPNLSFIQADASRTGLPASEWDLVVAADVIEHLYPTKTLDVYREAHRLLRPGGRLVIWTPAPTHILEWLRRRGVLRPDPTHVDYKTLARIHGEVEECGLRVVEARYAPSHLPVLSIIERVGQRWIRWLQRRIAVVVIKPGGSIF